MGSIGKVIAINISKTKGVVKDTIESGEFKEGHGLVGDAHAGKWHRQVSILGVESIKKMSDQGVKGLCSGRFAENMTTEGIDFYKLDIGTKIIINEVVLEITQIGKECHDGCEIKKQVGQCIMPKEGVFTRVLKSGIINKKDEIKIEHTDLGGLS